MTAPIAGMCCANCAFFERATDGFGECRRNAPQPNPCAFVTKTESIGTVKTDIHWPKVYNSNWCGQFSVRKKAQAQTAPKPVVVHRPPARSAEGKDILKLKPQKPEPAPRPPEM